MIKYSGNRSGLEFASRTRTDSHTECRTESPETWELCDGYVIPFHSHDSSDVGGDFHDAGEKEHEITIASKFS